MQTYNYTSIIHYIFKLFNSKFKIFITEKAKKLKNCVISKMEEFNKIACNGLTKNEIDTFKLTLSKILSNLNLI
jgi:DNA-binding MarR family transcriptional regulator